MKLSKTAWLILIIGVFIIIITSLGVTFLQQVNHRDQLREDLALAKNRLGNIQLDQLYSQREELTVQLSQTEADLDTARYSLSQPVNSIITNETLLDIAKTCGVDVKEIKIATSATAEMAGMECSITPFIIKVAGDLPQIIDFITRLNNDQVTSVISSVDILVAQPYTDTLSSATIRQLVYFYQDN